MDAGAQGSRTLYNMGNAAMQAAQEAKHQLLQKAADMLEASEADLEVDGGNRFRCGACPTAASPTPSSWPGRCGRPRR